MSGERSLGPTSYRFPYRINLLLLLLFWEAKQIGVTFLLMCAGNILNAFFTFAFLAIAYWIAYGKAKKDGKVKLRHKWWSKGLIPSVGGIGMSSRYFTDPFIREIYS